MEQFEWTRLTAAYRIQVEFDVNAETQKDISLIYHVHIKPKNLPDESCSTETNGIIEFKEPRTDVETFSMCFYFSHDNLLENNPDGILLDVQVSLFKMI